ncbi:MAG TPA: hypothetical protein VFC19_01725 [Candidatus Limnocylindrales bacterium]|nr:hypothetical protein [Candidatus Limnocylindrales bacterium]
MRYTNSDKAKMVISGLLGLLAALALLVVLYILILLQTTSW